MDWKLEWNSGLLDEIGLVYERAEKDTFLCRKLVELEESALDEAITACQAGGLLSRSNGGRVLSRTEFEALSPIDKETAIVMLGEVGFAARKGERNYIETDYSVAIIMVRLSSSVNKSRACTLFDLLNRLEKLDGSINVAGPASWTLELIVPKGSEMEYGEWKELISRLFPWITVSVLGTDQANIKAVIFDSSNSAISAGVLPDKESKKTVIVWFCFSLILFLIAFLCIKLAIVTDDEDTKLRLWGLGIAFVLFGGWTHYKIREFNIKRRSEGE